MRAWIVVGMLLMAGLDAQADCTYDLQQARKSYDLGLFEDVPEQLAPCLSARLSRAMTIEVRSLLARAYLQADETDKARKEVSAILRLDSTFEGGDPPRFAALVAQVRREEQTTQVASVSKTNESLREAPATVVVVTADEIQRRGYLDLEQLLHDLPGFDISRLNGDIYSNIYQRGYRSPNDRLLFLVDGVEQNELSSGILYLSRQYPLTNIDRVEVIYGPASTMYGANAYTGVISVITKDPETLAGENKTFGAAGQVTGGGYGAGYGDVTVAGRDRSGTIAWSVAMNVQQSKERDLSAFADWDYTYRNVDYAKQMRLVGINGRNFFTRFCPTTSPYFRCVNSQTIELTPEGENYFRSLDSGLIRDNGLGFDDRAQNLSLYGKIRISNLTLGVQAWQSQEGIASQYRALDVTGSTAWTPRYTAFYLKYSLPLDRLNVNVFTRYERSGIESDRSRFEYLHSYAKGFLTLTSLMPPCNPPSDPKPVGCPPGRPWVEEVSFGSLSSQLRGEVNATYDSGKTSGVAGLELAASSIQSQLNQIASGPGTLFHAVSEKPEQIQHTDIALYAQGSWKPWRTLKFVFAGRLTHNQIDNKAGASGFGTLFTPRVAVIYLPGNRLVLKAVYSEAFKDPTDAQKFGIVTGVNGIVSEGLKPETVRDIELGGVWEPTDRLSLESSLYQARYSDVVALGQLAGCQGATCRQYRNRDEIRIRGLQATARYRRGVAEIWGNYTHTEPFLTTPQSDFGGPLLDDQGKPIDRLPIADIAANRFNLGIDTHWPDRLRAGLRVHYVGNRKAGNGTTEPDNPFTRMDAHTTADAIISDRRLLRGMELQLIVDNLFDKQYYDPAADPAVGAPRVLQGGRSIYLRLVYGSSR
jgi:outer membrane receptor for ferrienterochelin and colicins